MHKFMRTIGFGGCDSDLEMDKIMRKLAKTASKTAVLERNDHPTLYDLRAELAPGMGIAMIGQMTEKGTFKREYAFPYVTGSDISSTAECSIQRHAERETYAGLLDEYRVGISLIFYMTNSIEYRSRRSKRLPVLAKKYLPLRTCFPGKDPAAGEKDSQTGGRLETGCQKAWKPLRSRTPGR